MSSRTGRRRTLTRQQVEQLLTTRIADLYGVPAEQIREVPDPADRYRLWSDAATLGDKLVPDWLYAFAQCRQMGVSTESNRQLARIAELVGPPWDSFEGRLGAFLVGRGVPRDALAGVTLADAVRLLQCWLPTSNCEDAAAVWGRWRVEPGEATFDGKVLPDLKRRHRRILTALVAAHGRFVLLGGLRHALSQNNDASDQAIRNYVHAIRVAIRAVAGGGVTDPIEDVDGIGYRLRIS